MLEINDNIFGLKRFAAVVCRAVCAAQTAFRARVQVKEMFPGKIRDLGNPEALC
jgi:hypothetical protein